MQASILLHLIAWVEEYSEPAAFDRSSVAGLGRHRAHTELLATTSKSEIDVHVLDVEPKRLKLAVASVRYGKVRLRHGATTIRYPAADFCGIKLQSKNESAERAYRALLAAVNKQQPVVAVLKCVPIQFTTNHRDHLNPERQWRR